ncbi:hypothetical protein [Chitinophaga solisilvae]|uniref:Uncharacterized protein n=1 Tax=Chitinophaga solisilvae TaxID=1233460 RepID=A0A9Q5GPZ4_9BACT|nr:hypothetical protein [Chitinophaga solisilvae]NSL86377.1 hypothetical protein [Chitinophaga solisilvae]
MATLLEDIQTHTQWIVDAFKADNLQLDYTIYSFIQIDRFFEMHSSKGHAVKHGRLEENLGPVLFSIGAYVGETLIRCLPGAVWETDDNDPHGEITIAVVLIDGTRIWPVQRVMKRFSNGSDDSLYPYGYELTKELSGEPFESSFWEVISAPKEEGRKYWWKFW